MADGISITDLEQKVEVSDNDNFAVDNGTNTNKVTAKQIKAYMEPDFVKKAGDTMIGTLVFENGIGIQFKKTDGSKYVLYVPVDNALKIFNENDQKGLYLAPEANYRPHYFDGSKGYKLEYIKEKYSDAQGNWYRVWSDGWVEQGGILIEHAAQPVITFLKPFANTVYSFYAIPSIANGQGSPVWNEFSFSQKTETSLKMLSSSYTTISWYACGQGAE